MKIYQTYRIVFLCGVVLSVTGCSSGSDRVTTNTTGMGTTPILFRIVAVEDDFNNDGVADTMFEFAYDTGGRVTTITESDTVAPDTNSVISFSYQGDNLVSQVAGNDVVTFTIENNRTVALEDTSEELQRYTYDNSGRIVAVEGDAFFLDDDCETLLLPGVDPEIIMPRYTLVYNTMGRLAQVDGSEGDGFVISYLANGNPNTITINGGCSDVETIVRYSYGTSGLASRATIVDEFGDITEYTFEYENGRPIRSVETVTEFSAVVLVITSTFSYNTEGRIESSTTTVDRDGGAPFTSTRTFRYEDEPCVEQVFINPVENLLVAPLRPGTRFEGGLRCGFLAQHG